jgi:hypothetical protein
MIQLFSKVLLKIGLGLIFIQEYITNYYIYIRRKFLKIRHIYNLKTNQDVFYEYLITSYLYDYHNDITDYFCEFNNDIGIYKTILPNITLSEIINLEDSINKNKNNLIDGLYNDKLIIDIYIIDSKTQNKINIIDYIMYIDKNNVDINLYELFKIYNLNYSTCDKIIIKYMSYEDYTEHLIESNIGEYLKRPILNIL